MIVMVQGSGMIVMVQGSGMIVMVQGSGMIVKVQGCEMIVKVQGCELSEYRGVEGSPSRGIRGVNQWSCDYELDEIAQQVETDEPGEICQDGAGISVPPSCVRDNGPHVNLLFDSVGTEEMPVYDSWNVNERLDHTVFGLDR